jgi:hypothetical protein
VFGTLIATNYKLSGHSLFIMIRFFSNHLSLSVGHESKLELIMMPNAIEGLVSSRPLLNCNEDK